MGTQEGDPFTQIEDFLREKHEEQAADRTAATRRHPSNIAKSSDSEPSANGSPAVGGGPEAELPDTLKEAGQSNQPPQPEPSNVIQFPLRSVVEYDPQSQE